MDIPHQMSYYISPGITPNAPLFSSSSLTYLTNNVSHQQLSLTLNRIILMQNLLSALIVFFTALNLMASEDTEKKIDDCRWHVLSSLQLN